MNSAISEAFLVSFISTPPAVVSLSAFETTTEPSNAENEGFELMNSQTY